METIRNSLLRGIFAHKKKRVTGDWRKQHAEELGKARSTNEQNRILIHSDSRIHNGNRPLGSHQPPLDGSLRTFILYTDVTGNTFIT